MTFGRALLVVATAGGLALLARSVLHAPVPLWVALTAFGVYSAIALAGVVCPQLGMYGRVLWRGPTDRGEVALTFDDGPHLEHTPKILELLDRADAKATFFVIGRKASAHPELLVEIAARGHALGIHGFDHDRFMTLRSAKRITDDLRRSLDAVQAACGQRPALFRPPVGLMSPRVAEAADKLSLQIIAWSVRGLDGVSSASAHRVAARVASRVRPGAIVLLHDGAEHDDHVPAAIAALPRVLDAMSAKGLRSVTLHGWLPKRDARE